MQVFLEPRTLYDTAIISTDNQITKYSISKILIILEADMSTEEAIDFFYYNIEGPQTIGWPHFVDDYFYRSEDGHLDT